jgi:hypothetical protein
LTSQIVHSAPSASVRKRTPVGECRACASVTAWCSPGSVCPRRPSPFGKRRQGCERSSCPAVSASSERATQPLI